MSLQTYNIPSTTNIRTQLVHVNKSVGLYFFDITSKGYQKFFSVRQMAEKLGFSVSKEDDPNG